jgi:hypothetical protein
MTSIEFTQYNNIFYLALFFIPIKLGRIYLFEFFVCIN